MALTFVNRLTSYNDIFAFPGYEFSALLVVARAVVVHSIHPTIVKVSDVFPLLSTLMILCKLYQHTH